MLSRIEVQNYRSLLDVKVNLSPFTLVIGANGSGKSNFLQLFYILTNFKIDEHDLGKPSLLRKKWLNFGITEQKHFNNKNKPQFIRICTIAGDDISVKDNDVDKLKDIYSMPDAKVHGLEDLIKAIKRVASIFNESNIFFERCAERISGKSFYRVEPRRIRKNGGIGEVRKKLPTFLNDIRKSAGMDAYFIIALDNDRAPEHLVSDDQTLTHNKIPGLSKQEQTKQCRFCEIEGRIKELWGNDSNNWFAKGAIAVPVQMLESWILIALDPASAEKLPIFAEKTQSLAKKFHNGAPLDQLKDLCDQIRYEKGGLEKGSFFLDVADKMNIEEVTEVSSSFAQFKNQIISW
ncbi:hypothetical protein Xen7305DRAFT_00015020 [Xenococcus sp. PCC 7305]|uniref:AAA family ATPase n=1 Tax=Xenococcus sp. PCC 7305 TaxID=102125 RepID=UPI0002AC9889|nr:AAA family ATPase [Xenococcus sp. PCC 7305]ELS01796.1 hypothetical protein Xen7305DRAFT_00015020 [Xenococcus sp. PCC 7305]